MGPPVKIIRLVIILIFLFIAAGSYAESRRYVRILVLADAESFSLKVDGFYEIEDALTKEVLYRGEGLKTAVLFYKGGIAIGKINARSNKVFIRADNAGVIAVNGRKFRGDIQLIGKDNLHLQAVNYVDPEDYIKGILYHESSHYWPLEALKAQAVSCRTFALYQMRENLAKDYDVTSDIYSQVYGGKTSERYRTNKAVEETKSEVLVYQGKVFPAYYHATCGGSTEDAALLWNTDILPLKVVLCGFCRESPHYNWHLVLPQSKIIDELSKAGYNGFKKIKNIEIIEKDLSGRNKTLKLITDKKDIRISAKDFRNIIGPNVIRSTKFNLEIADGDAVFIGFGWGHGVGLCQWGAYFMAKQGYNYQDILKFYYPGTDIETIRF